MQKWSDWPNRPANNEYQFYRRANRRNTHGTGKCIPDIVCFGGMACLGVRDRGDASSGPAKKGKAKAGEILAWLEGVSPKYSLNQAQDFKIPHLFAYVSCDIDNAIDGLYGTCGTKDKFWQSGKRRERSPRWHFHARRNTPLRQPSLECLCSIIDRSKTRETYLLLSRGWGFVR